MEAGQQSWETAGGGSTMPPLDFAGQVLSPAQITQRRQELLTEWSNLETLQKELEKERDEKQNRRQDAPTEREKLNYACQVSRVNKRKLGRLFQEKAMIVSELKSLWLMERNAAMDSEYQQLKTENDELRGRQSAAQFTIGEKRHQLDQELHQMAGDLASLYEKSGEIDAQLWIVDDPVMLEKLTAQRELISSKIETVNARISGKKLEMKMDNIEGIATGLQIENCNLREQLQAANVVQQPVGSATPPISPTTKYIIIRRTSLAQTSDQSVEVLAVGGAQLTRNIVNSALGSEDSVPFTNGQFETME